MDKKKLRDLAESLILSILAGLIVAAILRLLGWLMIRILIYHHP